MLQIAKGIVPGFSEYAKGMLAVYFVVLPNTKGLPNIKQIGLVKDVLVQARVAKNPSIQNVRRAQ